MSDYGGTIFNMPGKPRIGLAKEKSNLSKLANHTGKIAIDCPECGLTFTRYACHAKRCGTSYCSKACANSGQRKTVKMSCVICSSVFETIPCKVRTKHQVTCSESCSSVRQSQLVKDSAIFRKTWSRTRAQGKGKLTVEQVMEIGESAESTGALVKRYSVSDNTIRNARREWAKEHGKCEP